MSLLDQVARGFDKVIGAFSPVREMQRTTARVLTERLAFASRGGAYEGAQNDRTKAGWKSTSGSADSDLDADTLHSLRERSRDRVRNDALASAVTNALVDEVVGCGFRPKLAIKPERVGITQKAADELSERADDVWAEWAECCDSTGRLSFDRIQSVCMSSALVNGDVFIAPLMRKPERGERFELKLELIEGDRVDDPYGIQRPGLRQGVEIDPVTGAPLAYFVEQHHPGDQTLPGAQGTQRKWARVPAWSKTGRPNILHVMDQERPEQTRGRPFLSPVLNMFRDLDDYVETELIAAQMAACFAVFVKRNDPFGAALARSTTATSGTNKRYEELVPGMIGYLGPGEEIQSANPGRPNSVFGEYVMRMQRWITGGLGMPYAIATRDCSGQTYSQNRGEILSARRMFQRRQRWLINQLVRPVWALVLEEAWLKGLLPFGNTFFEARQEWTRTHWIAPGWGWVDPEAEVKAYETGIKLGITSRSQIAATGDGEDVMDIFRQLAREAALAKELQLNVEPDRGGAPAVPGDQKPKGNNTKKGDSTADAQKQSKEPEPAEAAA